MRSDDNVFQQQLFDDYELQRKEYERQQRMVKPPENYAWTGEFGLVRMTEYELLDLLHKVGDEVAKDALRILMKRTAALDRTTEDQALLSPETAATINDLRHRLEVQAETLTRYRVELQEKVLSKQNALERLAMAKELLSQMESLLSDEYDVEPLTTEAFWLNRVRVFLEQPEIR